MVKVKPLRIKFAKHACKICGRYTPGKVMSISREREHRNSLLICRDCLEEIKSKTDEVFDEKFVCSNCAKEFNTKKGLLIHMSKCGKETV